MRIKTREQRGALAALCLLAGCVGWSDGGSENGGGENNAAETFVPVTGIELTSPARCGVNTPVALTAAVTPANATNRTTPAARTLWPPWSRTAS